MTSETQCVERNVYVCCYARCVAAIIILLTFTIVESGRLKASAATRNGKPLLIITLALIIFMLTTLYVEINSQRHFTIKMATVVAAACLLIAWPIMVIDEAGGRTWWGNHTSLVHISIFILYLVIFCRVISSHVSMNMRLVLMLVLTFYLLITKHLWTKSQTSSDNVSLMFSLNCLDGLGFLLVAMILAWLDQLKNTTPTGADHAHSLQWRGEGSYATATSTPHLWQTVGRACTEE